MGRQRTRDTCHRGLLRRASGSFFRLLAVMGGMVVAALPSLAADRALLIAASNYQAQPLQGPANDAALFYHTLRARGMDPAQIRLLADGLPRREGDPVPDGLPTRAAILAAFDRLANEVRPGDSVFIAMSGHGTQAPASDPAHEPDGLDELFLPIDVGRWDQSREQVVNALRDDEIGAHLDRITGAGALVWIVIDSCHAGTATRNIGGRSLRARFVSPHDLGIPPAPRSSSDSGAPEPPIDRASPGRFVAFYAAQANEVAYETQLPADDAGGSEPHGVLSFFVAQALARRPNASYLEIAQVVRAGYDELAGAWPRFPTPMFEGPLERAALGGTGALADAWPARRDRDGVRIAAGSLHGLGKDDQVLFHAAQGGGDDPAALGVVTSLGLAESLVSLDRSALERLPSQLIAKAVVAAGPRPLRVARPKGPDPVAKELGGLLARRLQGRADIELVDAMAAADLKVVITDEWVALAPTGASLAETIATGASPVPLDLGPEAAAAGIVAAIVARAPGFRLLTLAGDFVGTRAARDLSVELHLLRDPLRAASASGAEDPARMCQRPPPEPPAAAEPVAPGSIPELFHCDTLYLTLEAQGRAPVDIGLFFIDSQGAIAAPEQGQVRLDRKAPPFTVPLTVTTWNWQRASPSTVGLERLVLLGLRRSAKVDQAYQADFAAALGLAKPGTRAPTGPPAATHPFLRGLGPDGGEGRRGLGGGDPREDGFMHIVRWQTRASSAGASN